MKKSILLSLIALSVIVLSAKTDITSLGNNSYLVKWQIPEWQLINEGDFVSLQVSDLIFPSAEGAPLVPFDMNKVSIPASGSVSINITKKISNDITLEKRLQPVPIVSHGAKADVYQYLPNDVLYATSSPEVVTVLPANHFRNLFYVPIRINPFVYDGRNQLSVCTNLEYIISISGNTEQKSSLPLDDLSALMSKQMINSAQASNWQASDRATINYADFNQSDQWVRIETDKDGMYKVTPAMLSMLDIGEIDPTAFRMFTTGGEVQSDATNYSGPAFREIPIYVSGESDHSFDSSDYILFYGRDRNGFEMNQNIKEDQYYNPYSNAVCYWLTYSDSFSSSPNRISMSNSIAATDTVVTTPETVRVENEVYQRTPIGFDWYQGKFFGNSSAVYGPYSIYLEDVDITKPQTLELMMIQEFFDRDPGTPHNVKLLVNDISLKSSNGAVQTWSWNGSSNKNVIRHTGSSFSQGNNTIKINVLRSYADNLFLDYYQVAYQKLLIKRSNQYIASVADSLASRNVRYEFTGSNTGIRVFKTEINTGAYNVTELPVITNANGFNFVGNASSAAKYMISQAGDYYTPSLIQSVTPVDLAHETQSYDNLIIAPTEYIQQAQSLAGLYFQKWQIKSKVVLMQDIFNQFNGGMPDPGAIRLYIKHCMNFYPALPITSVTLLGSGTNDWRNYSGQSATKNKLIVYQKSVPGYYGEYGDTAVSDDNFVLLNSSANPELAIGRYPAKSQSELDIMLNNFDNYINNPQPGIWRNSLLFMADDLNNGPYVGEYSHSKDLQTTSTMINKSVLIDKIFAIDYDYDEFQNKPKAREDMFKAINNGELVWYYIGHGSYDTLGAEDYFKGSVDMGRFNNPGKLPLFIAASCDVAQYDSFSFDSAAEKVLLVEDRGAIASIAATRLSNGPANNNMFQHFFKYSINLRNPLGYSLVMAKNEYGDPNNNMKYNILGDPLLHLSTPKRDSTMTFETATKTDTMYSGEQIRIHGEFSGDNINDSTQVLVFNPDVVKRMDDIYHTIYTFRGKPLYRGSVDAANSQYDAGFIVPKDVTTGDTGLILSYLWDSEKQTDYINYLPSVSFSNQTDSSLVNSDLPDIKLYLNDTDFQSGDVVSTNPLLIAKISDQNGINMTNSPGHSILLIKDFTVSKTDVTNYFNYDKDSVTSGTLQYPLTGLSEGPHTLQLIAFDNLNEPSVGMINFTITKKSVFSIKDFLPYPNPMKKDGYFTFVLSEPADVKLALYTIRGKKIKTISSFAPKGYNQIYWDGRDADGDLIANNTYFIKLTAKSTTSKGKDEKTEKLIIYH